MLRSQNGYSANDRSKIKTYVVPGTKTQLAVRKGDVATVLLYVAEQFDRYVEDIDTPSCAGYAHDALAVSGSEPSRVRDDWAFAFRNIRGSSTTLSNHSSGTAIDLNATQHPRGVAGTFTAAQKRAVRKILTFCGGVVRWGEDYRHATVDGMHFEIDAGSVKVALLAAKIRRVRKAEARAAADAKHKATVAKAAKKKAAAALATKKAKAAAAALAAALAAAAAAAAISTGGVDAQPAPRPSATATSKPTPTAKPAPKPTPTATYTTPARLAKPVLTRVIAYRPGHRFQSGGDVRRVAALVGCRRVSKGWGPTCDKAVRKWQRAHGLKVDGEFGAKSAKAAGWTWHP